MLGEARRPITWLTSLIARASGLIALTGRPAHRAQPAVHSRLTMLLLFGREKGGFFPRSTRWPIPPSTCKIAWNSAGPVPGLLSAKARVVEVLCDGRYRLERLDGPPFPREGSIFAEEQLWLKAPQRLGSA